MNFLFAWRYFKAKKSTNAINIISWVSMTAIVVGTASLILVLSVFNGFEDLVKSLYSSFYPDLRVSPRAGKTITLTSAQLQQLAGLPGIRSMSLVAESEALIRNGDQQAKVSLKGVDEQFTKVTRIADKTMKGKFQLGDTEHPLAILGSGIENALGIEAEREIVPLSVYLFKRGNDLATDPMASINNAYISSAGTFVIQQEFDDKYVITNLGFVKRMAGFGPDEYSGLELSVDDPLLAAQRKEEVQQALGRAYSVQTRYEQNQSLYTVMRTEKWVIYVVLTLILAVAAFNMVGALTMLVWEKQKDIHVLKALGANNSYIQRIFLSEGLLLGILGGGLGILLAAITCWLQIRYKLIPLQGGSFLIDYYPVKMVATDFVLVLSTILVVALLASWFPSRKAAREPIELRS
jgi:lipoprotein-releasing system permease protein